MSQKANERRVRLNLDVWRHSATFLDVAGLGVLASAGKESQKLVSSVPADVWRANLCALAPAIARAFPEKRDARNLCRAWLRRWRATDCSALVLAHRGELVPRLCVPAQIGGPVRQPSVVFAIGSGRDTRQQKSPRSTDFAGVMNWDSILSDGTRDDDNSLALIPTPPTMPTMDGYSLYRVYTEREIYDELATSCFVVSPDRTLMIELWRDEFEFSDFEGAPNYAHMTYRHGSIELSRCRAHDDAASVLSHMAENESAPEGTAVMTLLGYVRFREISSGLGDRQYQMLDATVSFGISERDTQYEFDDLALMLDMALRNHPDADGAHVPSRAVFALPAD
jgi:hypothetical protein